MIREKLGDAKEQVREKSQMLLQQIMQDTVNSPQVMCMYVSCVCYNLHLYKCVCNTMYVSMYMYSTYVYMNVCIYVHVCMYVYMYM